MFMNKKHNICERDDLLLLVKIDNINKIVTFIREMTYSHSIKQRL